MSRTERIVVQLPLSVGVVSRLIRAVDKEFPGAKMAEDRDRGNEFLILEVAVDDRD